MGMVKRNLGMVLSWLFATISTGALAWGVVQLAAAQASDGPVRPLTAAEVNALPVSTASVRTTATTVAEFPASEEPVIESSTTSSTTTPATTVAIAAATTVTSEPAVPATVAAATTSTTTTTAPTTTTATATATSPPTQVPAAELRTFNLVGGSAQVELGSETLRLIWARPNSGFSMDQEIGETSLEIKFEADHHESELQIERSDGDWDIEIKEQAEEDEPKDETNSTEADED